MKGKHILAAVGVIALFVGATQSVRCGGKKAAVHTDFTDIQRGYLGRMMELNQGNDIQKKQGSGYDDPAGDMWADQSDECIEWRSQATGHQTKGGMSIRCRRVHPAFQRKK